MAKTLQLIRPKPTLVALRGSEVAEIVTQFLLQISSKRAGKTLGKSQESAEKHFKLNEDN